MSDTDYCYPPDYIVLKNKLNLTDAAELDYFEREFVVQRIAEGLPSGRFDLAHLRAIHRHLFQDVYDWAGDIRTVEISKGGHQFQFRHYIETGMADVHRRINAHNLLRDLSANDFADLAGEIIGDLNYVHPFREGNGRTQAIYLEQLAGQAGHALDLKAVQKEAWINASRDAHHSRYDAMRNCIAIGLDRDHDYEHDDG